MTEEGREQRRDRREYSAWLMLIVSVMADAQVASLPVLASSLLVSVLRIPEAFHGGQAGHRAPGLLH